MPAASAAAPAAGDAPPLLGVERSAAGAVWRGRCAHERLALALAQSLDLPDTLARVLAGRGITPDRAAAWLNPTLRETLPDPSALADMDRAAARIADALEGGETVGIFGDYDVDGATSSALLRLYVEAVGGRARVHIPDRRREGYGPNAAALESLAREGVRLVVTVDCGTTATAALAAAADAGQDVIVVDHHQEGAERPRCFALVNPNRRDDSSGQGALAAVGVAFLLVVAVNRALRARGRFAAGGEPDLFRFLDLVALGAICDMAPLTGLNRAFARQGLRVMARRGNPGLAALADAARLETAPDAYHAGFLLGPRINAGGRIGDADLGHRLLCARSIDDARPIAERLDRLNAERREIEARVLGAAMAAAEAAMADSPAALTVAGDDWREGVIGLVANRLVERWRRPAAVFALDGGVAKGSARSVPGFDIGAAVADARLRGLATAGGGHAMAAGMTVPADGIPAFARFLESRAAASGAVGARPVLWLDGALAPAGATVELIDSLEAAGPWGIGNPAPRFALPACRIAFADVVGRGHVRCRLADPGGAGLSAIAFRAADGPVGRALLAARGGALHVAGALRRDRWRGRDSAQLAIDDVAEAR